MIQGKEKRWGCVEYGEVREKYRQAVGLTCMTSRKQGPRGHLHLLCPSRNLVICTHSFTGEKPPSVRFSVLTVCGVPHPAETNNTMTRRADFDSYPVRLNSVLLLSHQVVLEKVEFSEFYFPICKIDHRIYIIPKRHGMYSLPCSRASESVLFSSCHWALGQNLSFLEFTNLGINFRPVIGIVQKVCKLEALRKDQLTWKNLALDPVYPSTPLGTAKLFSSYRCTLRDLGHPSCITGLLGKMGRRGDTWPLWNHLLMTWYIEEAKLRWGLTCLRNSWALWDWRHRFF